jgi:hypothetical protein
LKLPIGGSDNENSNHQQRGLFRSIWDLSRVKELKLSKEKKNNLLLVAIDDMNRILFQETITAIQHNIKEAMLNNYPDRKHPIFLLNFADYMSDKEDINLHNAYTIFF